MLATAEKKLDNTNKRIMVRAWEIWKADVPAYADTSQFKGVHYYLIICNDKAGKYSPLIEGIPFTSKEATLPNHISMFYDFEKIGLTKPCILSMESKHKIDRRWLKKKVGCISSEYVKEKIRTAFVNDSGLFEKRVDNR